MGHACVLAPLAPASGRRARQRGSASTHDHIGFSLLSDEDVTGKWTHLSVSLDASLPSGAAPQPACTFQVPTDRLPESSVRQHWSKLEGGCSLLLAQRKDSRTHLWEADVHAGHASGPPVFQACAGSVTQAHPLVSCMEQSSHHVHRPLFSVCSWHCAAVTRSVPARPSRSSAFCHHRLGIS